MNDVDQKLFELMFKHHSLFLRLDKEDIQDYLQGKAELRLNLKIAFTYVKRSFLIWKNLSGKHHRDGDKPAVICADGSLFWYRNGKRHRDHDQPAVVYADGRREWWVKGVQHRDHDQPAVIAAGGDLFWYRNGKRHRDGDKPAMIGGTTGTQVWYKNGYIHREGDKPSIVYGF